jgi:hypothetical protein
MNTYDPDLNPDPEEWLATPESRRLDLVTKHHIENQDELEDEIPSMEAHCSFHTIVENQLAMDSPPLVRKTLERLLAAGTGRHDAIHAIANAMAQELFHMGKNNEMFNEARYCKSLKKLDPPEWI